MDYIKSIRKYVGHAPIMATAVTCIIDDKEKGILFEKRSDNGLWCVPGGAIELEETLEEALKREVKEETNLDIKNPNFFSVQSGVHIIYPNQDEVYYTDVVYVVNEYDGELKHDEESLELCWFPIKQLPDNIIPIQKEYLKKYLDSKKD